MPKPLTVWITINWKILKEMGIPDSLTCLLRKLYAGQEATVRTGHGTTDWFQIGKGARQGCILSPCLSNLYAEYIMRNAGLEEAQAEIKIARRNINNLWYAGICREKAMTTQYSCLEKSYGRRSLEDCSPWGHEELDMTERLHFHFSHSCIEGNGNPRQYSCLESPRDRGA